MSCELIDASTCTYRHANGAEYEEISCVYKALEPFYMNWEKCFNSLNVVEWSRANPMIPIVSVTLYAIALVWGKNFMKDREPYKFRNSMAAWNLFLSIFSYVMMIRSVVGLTHNVVNGEFRDLICTRPTEAYGYGSTGFWVCAFMLSKIAELMDTFFIIAHKKPLIFLHYWHHITVLLYSWFAFVRDVPSSIIFMAVNSGVHAIMYGYYFLMTIKMKPKWINPVWITVAQLVQMVIGLTVTGFSVYYFKTATEEKPCDIEADTFIPCFCMYGSYFLLFLNFFIQRYISRKNKKSKKTE